MNSKLGALSLALIGHVQAAAPATLKTADLRALMPHMPPKRLSVQLDALRRYGYLAHDGDDGLVNWRMGPRAVGQADPQAAMAGSQCGARVSRCMPPGVPNSVWALAAMTARQA